MELKNKTTTEQYAVDGALHYASFVKNDYDVIAIGVSGDTDKNYRLTSILWPKNTSIDKIMVIEDGGYSDTLMPYKDYERCINKKLNRSAKPKVGMINPPYSQKGDKSELNFIYSANCNNKLDTPW